MSNEQTEQLIVDLAAGLTPVQTLRPLPARLAAWIGPAVATAAVTIGLIGARRDWLSAIARPEVILALALMSSAAITAAIAALRLSVPGADSSRAERWLPIGAVALWLLALTQMMRGGDSVDTVTALHVICVLRVIAIAVIPAALLIANVRRGYTLDSRWPPVLIALAGGAVGAAAIQLICPIDQAAHVLVSHAAPLVAMVVVSAVWPWRQ